MGDKAAQTSHMLKTGRRGNPFCKDTHDLFATLMVSLDLSDRTRFFRTYANSFTTDEAAANLSSLRFSQSNRTTDPNDPQRIVTTTTTTTFSMSREIAKGICQHFMDARLIMNAADPTTYNFKDRGIYQVTPKGLHVLERFITRNGINADHLTKVFTTQQICLKLIYLDRRTSDDEIHVSRSVIDLIFKRFAGGRHPNYITDPLDSRQAQAVPRPFAENLRPSDTFDRTSGVELQDVSEKSRTGSGACTVVKQVFSSTAAVDWLLDCSTCCCREEAADLLAHFVRYGLIALHADKSKVGDRVLATTVPGQGAGGADEYEYRFGPRVLYKISEEGRRTAASDVPAPAKGGVTMESKLSSDGSGIDDDASSTRSLDRNNASAERSFAGGTGLSNIAESQIVGRHSVADLFKADFSETGAANWVKDQHSTTTRLRAILEEPALRTLFRDFLRQNYCDENLGFWIDVSDFRRRFSTTSSAVGGGASAVSQRKKTQGASSAMEAHQQNLVAAALTIYNTYLAPLSPNELNIDHNLRADVVHYVNRSLAEVGATSSGAAIKGSPKPDEPQDVPPLRATQVQTLLKQYERIQEHIFRLLATDQVPRFVRTEPFMRLMDPNYVDKNAPAGGEKPVGAAAPAAGGGGTTGQGPLSSSTQSQALRKSPRPDGGSPKVQ